MFGDGTIPNSVIPARAYPAGAFGPGSSTGLRAPGAKKWVWLQIPVVAGHVWPIWASLERKDKPNMIYGFRVVGCAKTRVSSVLKS